MPIDIFSVIGAGANVSVKILETWFQLVAVDEETADLLRLTEHVDRNVTEARRLRRLKASLINVEDKEWMDIQISDCHQALQEVQQLIEPARVDTANMKPINPKTRALWVLKNSSRVKHKYHRLSTCHQTLNMVIGVLQARDVVVVAPLPTNSPSVEPPPYTKEMETLFNWPSRMRSKKSFIEIKNIDSLTPPTSSMSTPSTPAPYRTDIPTASSDEDHRPSLLSATSEGSLPVTLSSFYSSIDEIDKSNTFDPSSPRQPPRDLWSPVTLPGAVNGLSHSMKSSRTSVPILPPLNFLNDDDYQTKDDQPYTTSTRLKTFTDDPAEQSRSVALTNGQEWLACYASRWDIRNSHDDDPQGQ